MSSLKFYGMDGQPISLEEWGRLAGSDQKIVARSDLPGGVWVSTVLLGLDHSFGSGPPVIFETMVFESQDNLEELDCERYCTRAEAELGHEAMVTKWTGWIPCEPYPEDEK
jgi:hypothetical protein